MSTGSVMNGNGSAQNRNHSSCVTSMVVPQCVPDFTAVKISPHKKDESDTVSIIKLILSE